MLEAEVVSSINGYLRNHGICYANEIRMGICKYKKENNFKRDRKPIFIFFRKSEKICFSTGGNDFDRNQK